MKILANFSRKKLPLEFLLQNEEFEKYDHLIIDESQDLINETNLLVFDHILKGGLEKGRWSLFGDFEKQNLYEEDSNIEILNQFSFSKYEPLNINCRNSLKITDQNKMMTGVTYKSCLNIDNSERVSIKFPIESSQIKELDNIISKLLNDGVNPQKITILYPEKSFLRILFEKSVHSELIRDKEIDHETIHSFKGLENDIIIVIGFKELISDKAKQLLYVAISRATFKLYLLFSNKLESEFTYLISNQ